jgi:CBS-domain-containing membrane protein
MTPQPAARWRSAGRSPSCFCCAACIRRAAPRRCSRAQSYGGIRFAGFPILANSALPVAAGMLYNTATGRCYPHLHRKAAAGPAGDARSARADLDAVLARYNQVLDVSRDDLEALLHDTEAGAFRRKVRGLRCTDIMTAEPLAAHASQRCRPPGS